MHSPSRPGLQLAGEAGWKILCCPSLFQGQVEDDTLQHCQASAFPKNQVLIWLMQSMMLSQWQESLTHIKDQDYIYLFIYTERLSMN